MFLLYPKGPPVSVGNQLHFPSWASLALLPLHRRGLALGGSVHPSLGQTSSLFMFSSNPQIKCFQTKGKIQVGKHVLLPLPVSSCVISSVDCLPPCLLSWVHGRHCSRAQTGNVKIKSRLEGSIPSQVKWKAVKASCNLSASSGHVSINLQHFLH